MIDLEGLSAGYETCMDVLLVEDDPVSQHLLERRMRKRGHSVDCVQSAEAALEKLAEKDYQMIFLDIGLPGMNGIELNRWVRENDTEPPTYVLVGTGETGETRLNEILDAGADDYVAKPYQSSQLDTRLAVAENSVENLCERSRLQRELAFLAEHDPLTGLLNRRQLESIINAAADSDGSKALLQLDLDHFKTINDTFGHLEGDKHLIEVARLLRKHLPDSAQIVRFGGDEFVAVLPKVTMHQATDLADRLIEKISGTKIQQGSLTMRSGASIGITRIRSGLSAAELLKEVDTACYRAKSLGKNCSQVYVPFDSDLFLKSDFKEAIDGDRLELWFQPICDLKTGAICFQEALLRFLPAKGKPAVEAAQFMSEINSAKNAPLLDRFVVREVCKILAENPGLTTSVNIHAGSVCDWTFVGYVEQQLKAVGVQGQRLILEITETREIPDPPLAKSIIERFAALGVRSALDDLGAGFTSIFVLKDWSIPLVKVDGQLIRDLPNDRFNRTFIEALGYLAKGLGFHTVAERIETKEEWFEAVRLGVHWGQGHLIAVARREPYSDKEIQLPFLNQALDSLSEVSAGPGNPEAAPDAL